MVFGTLNSSQSSLNPDYLAKKESLVHCLCSEHMNLQYLFTSSYNILHRYL